MRIATASLLLTVLLAFNGSVFAGKPMFPKQPKLSSAYESLTLALKQVEKSRAEKPGKHLANATAALSSAKIDLETAKKNKGSARVEAIKQIEQAQQGIDAGKADEARACIAKAMEYVTRAAANGR
jgi:hypothetical protein